MYIGMRDLTAKEVLAGALTGRSTLQALLERINGASKTPEIVFVDFSGIEIATASFLRESILEFRDIVRRRWPNYYPVVANANESIIEELSILLEAQRDVLALCEMGNASTPHSARLIGTLEPKQQLTFDLVQQLGDADAGELMQAANATENVGQTAWNNRLASLCRLGLLMEHSQGRAKRYRPLPLEN
jgi:hypothetical protein